MQKELLSLRENIDIIDNEILKLFLKRMEVVDKIADLKNVSNSKIQNKEREQEILNKISKNSGIYKKYAVSLFENMMALSRDRQHERSCK